MFASLTFNHISILGLLHIIMIVLDFLVMRPSSLGVSSVCGGHVVRRGGHLGPRIAQVLRSGVLEFGQVRGRQRVH